MAARNALGRAARALLPAPGPGRRGAAAVPLPQRVVGPIKKAEKVVEKVVEAIPEVIGGDAPPMRKHLVGGYFPLPPDVLPLMLCVAFGAGLATYTMYCELFDPDEHKGREYEIAEKHFLKSPKYWASGVLGGTYAEKHYPDAYPPGRDKDPKRLEHP